ncbi:MAG TPA: serine/threonine-protein kinase [Pirellulales bacterium]|jgi:tRNA A-37 threonylcarbamoyl transferase component Bud32|nr:serine/threonine-protein kinase [Pirellulales bacterium]
MSGNEVAIAFNRTLHQALPTPLAHAYRKAYNSQTPKELHDNACLFGLCLLRFLSVLGLALVRQLRVALSKEEIELLDKLDRPAEGDWHRWLVRAAHRVRESHAAPDSLGAALDAYLHRKRDSAQSELPSTLGQLLSHLENKVVVRKDANSIDFLLVLIRYRNDTLGHGAVLREELNQLHGDAILRAATELASTLPLGDRWELAYVAKSSLGSTAVECQMVHLTGPDWLRGMPLSFPRGYPAPLQGHVIVMAKPGGAEHVDLHPLLVFHNERVLFFNSLRGRSPGYLEYDTAQKTTVEAAAADYAEFKGHFGAATDDSAPQPAERGESRPAPQPFLPPAERFRFERLLGRGGMGEVWLGYDEVLRRPVAIKRVRAELLGSGTIDRRFLQEARDAARLSHPNIVQILSVDSDSQGPYLVLEFMEGASLRQLLQTGPLQLPVALAYLRQMLQALQHAHEHGLVHRDVKPENILLTKAGVPKLADFGLAWLHEEHESEQPREESLGEGTRLYMAPELRDHGADPSPHTDLYALGVAFYEMLTARPPQHFDVHKVPSSALPLFRKLTHFDPNLRYESAQAALHDCLEMERALELAGRTQEETVRRIAKTTEQSLQLLGDGRVVDAQAGFQRILAEDPENISAQTGLLLAHIMTGDMEQGAARFRALAARAADDAVLARFRAFIEGIPAPAVLRITPQPLPFSYRVADLRRGQFVKELIEWSAETINLGDVGEVLVDLLQKRHDRRAVHDAPEAGWHRLLFDLDAVKVEADFRFRFKIKTFFLPTRLLAADVTLTITAEPFETYRFVRYLTYSMAQRFKRGAADLVRPESAAIFGYDAKMAKELWDRLNCDIRQGILGL